MKRESNIELYRIIVMFLIVAHHCVINSGVIGCVESNPFALNSIFLFLFGAWGKVGINCFVLITGYFMCESNITIRKYAKLLCEILFYNIVIGLVFIICGYDSFSVKAIAKMFLLITNMAYSFVSAFLVFYLCIPFLNKLVHNLTAKEHLALILIGLFVYTAPLYVPFLSNCGIHYVVWFVILYFIASYIRLHSENIFKSNSSSFWGYATLVSIAVTLFCLLLVLYVKRDPWIAYDTLTMDCNAIFAVIVSFCSFMYFKNIKIHYSKFINTIAASTFGVLLIHTNSDSMRQWLWNDLLNIPAKYGGGNFIIYVFSCNITIFAVCIVIDYIRIKFVETPVFGFLDKRFVNCKHWK